MSQDGLDSVALWREAGEWWSNEPYREYKRARDTNGIIRETVREMPSLGSLEPGRSPEVKDDNRDDWSLRIRKTRDEKVARACGLIKDFQPRSRSPRVKNYGLLHVLSGYSFGYSTMLCEEISVLASTAGISSVALVDRFSLAGAVEHSRMAKKVGIKALIGASIEIEEGGEIVLIAKSKTGYEQLSKLITDAQLNQHRGFPLSNWSTLERYSRDLLCLTGGDRGPINRLIAQKNFREALKLTKRLASIYGQSSTFIEIERSYLPWELQVNHHLVNMAKELGLTAVAGGVITHARREHYTAQDCALAASTLCLIEEVIGRKPHRFESQPQIPLSPDRSLNAERFIRTPTEMESLFSDSIDLLENTRLVEEQCDDDVLPHRTQLPQIFEDSHHAVREITLAGALERYPRMSSQQKRRLDHELSRITRLNFSGHFLTAWEMCRWASEHNILFSGRGSVVDSMVAFCLGMSRIDAYQHNLHFDRFLPEDGSKRPDIDIDFEAHRRDDVRDHLVTKYGTDRVATVAAIGTYRSRGIIREIGKVFGLPDELIGFLAKKLHGSVAPNNLEKAIADRPELRNSNVPLERFKWVFAMAERLMDVPRNIRAHSSGVVISSRPLAETVPVMWSCSEESGDSKDLKIIQWDKRSAKYFFDKFDVLCLRGQDVLSGTQARVRLQDISFDVQAAPVDHDDNYRTMRSGELIGIPQSASPAMRQAHMRLQTKDLHDASLVQAGIRPGVGGAVKINELIARRRGKPYSFDHPDLEEILGITYGIIVFQEQVDQLLQKFAGYSSGEAEETREAIHEKRREDYGQTIKEHIIERILDRGYSQIVADQVFELVSGFKGYGFAQGHALAFAEVSLRSIYCQQNFPAQYFAALMSAQPAGYYGPCTIANEARIRGVSVLPPCVEASEVEFSVEDVLAKDDPKIVVPNAGLRTGLMQIASLSEQTRNRIVQSDLRDKDREHVKLPRFSSFFDFVAKIQPPRDELEILILSGALDKFCANRRAMLWAIPIALDYMASVRSLTTNACQAALPIELNEPSLEDSTQDFTPAEKAVYERQILGMDVEAHLMYFERERVSSKGGISSYQAKNLHPGLKAIVVGNPIRLRFPPTKSGRRVVFFDLEDETGLLNVTCFDDVYQKYGHAIICSSYVTIIGEAQDRDGHTAFLAHHIFAYKPFLLTQVDRETLPLKSADFLVG